MPFCWTSSTVPFFSSASEYVPVLFCVGCVLSCDDGWILGGPVKVRHSIENQSKSIVWLCGALFVVETCEPVVLLLLLLCFVCNASGRGAVKCSVTYSDRILPFLMVWSSYSK